METLNVAFTVPPPLLSVLKGIGVPLPSHIAHCPLTVGDVIAFPPPHLIALRVVSRAYVLGTEGAQDSWCLHLEQTDPPGA